MREMEGIVMKTTRYGESSVIAELLTAEEGLLTIIAGSLQSKRGRAHAALLKTGSPVLVVIYYKPTGNMHRLKQVSPSYFLQRIPFSIVKSSLLLFAIDVARNAFRSYSGDAETYHFLIEEVKALDQAQSALALFPITFMMKLSDNLGFGPEYAENGAVGYFDLYQGVFSHQIPQNPHHLSESDTHCFWELGRYLQERGKCPKLDRATRTRLLDALITFFRFHIDPFQVPKSHQILSDLFHPDPDSEGPKKP
jgi:DNA repair protein RecO (recombination protein O)